MFIFNDAEVLRSSQQLHDLPHSQDLFSLVQLRLFEVALHLDCVCACVFVHVPNVSSKAQLSPPKSVICSSGQTSQRAGESSP